MPSRLTNRLRQWGTVSRTRLSMAVVTSPPQIFPHFILVALTPAGNAANTEPKSSLECLSVPQHFPGTEWFFPTLVQPEEPFCVLHRPQQDTFKRSWAEASSPGNCAVSCAQTPAALTTCSVTKMPSKNAKHWRTPSSAQLTTLLSLLLERELCSFICLEERPSVSRTAFTSLDLPCHFCWQASTDNVAVVVTSQQTPTSAVSASLPSASTSMMPLTVPSCAGSRPMTTTSPPHIQHTTTAPANRESLHPH